MSTLTIRNWQTAFNQGLFDSMDRTTQIKAGWYDWFCKDEYLANKTKKMAEIIQHLKDGGKIDLDTTYIIFKNSCLIDGNLFDELKIMQIDGVETKLSIKFNHPSLPCKYNVYMIQNYFKEPIFSCNHKDELIEWLNTSWNE